MEISNPVANRITTIPLSSLEYIDKIIDDGKADSGYMIELNSNTNPFVLKGTKSNILTPSYTGQGKSVYVLIFKL